LYVAVGIPGIMCLQRLGWLGMYRSERKDHPDQRAYFVDCAIALAIVLSLIITSAVASEGGQRPVIAATNAAGTSANSAQASATPSVPTVGTWYNVSPSGPGGAAVQTVGADPTHPGTLYAAFDAAGIYKSTDYGQTWRGPINTGANGVTVGRAGGSGITVGNNGVIYFASIRNVSGGAFGLFKSTDGGVDWKLENVAPAERGGTPIPVGQQDLYYPQIDPYNANHLIITGHESNWIAESTDGGVTWTALNEPPPSPATGTAFMYFINTGVAGTAGNHSSGGTANTWIWIAQGVGGGAGATWTQPSSFPNSSWTWGAGQFAVVNDGTHNILIGAMWVNGIWRYVEP
jgi:hypothetical protein